MLRAISNLRARLPLNIVAIVMLIALFSILNIASASQAVPNHCVEHHDEREK